VAIQALKKFDINAFDGSTLSNTYTAHQWTPRVCVSPATAQHADFVGELPVEGARFIKGFMVALGFEAVTAIGVYGLWQVWHVLR
jgi:hypothetical protein